MAGRFLSSNTASNGKTSTSRRRKMRGKIGVGFGKWRILKPRGVSRNDSVSSANLQKPRGNCFRSERKKRQLLTLRTAGTVAAIALMIGRSRTYRPSLWARIFLSESWKLVLSASSSDRIRLQLGADEDIPCLDVTEVSASQAPLWSTVEIRSKGRVDVLLGLNCKCARSDRSRG